MPDSSGRFSDGSTVERRAIAEALGVWAASHFREVFGLELGADVSWSPAEDVNWAETFAVGDRLCVSWVFRGRHTGADPAFPRASARSSEADSDGDPKRLEIRANGLGLGAPATGREVHLKVLSVGSATIEGGVLVKAELMDSRWDSLSALGQIGVQALGRPVGATPVLPVRR